MRLVSAFLFAALILALPVRAATPTSGHHPTQRRVLLSCYQPPAGKVKIAFFDADSTLRVAPSGKPSANGAKDVALLPNLVPAMKRLEAEGYLIAIVSNQGGIAAGFVTFEDAQAALVYCCEKMARLGITVHHIDFAEGNGPDRKPDIGMGRRLADLVKSQLGRDVDWEKSMMVGDSAWKKGVDLEPDGTPGEDHSNADRFFAENLTKAFGGVAFHHPRNFFAWLRHGVRNFSTYADLVAFIHEHPEMDPGVNGDCPPAAPVPAPAAAAH